MTTPSLPRLQRAPLAAAEFSVDHVPGAPRHPVNILQFGDGNFLRGFVDWMVDSCNGAGLFKGGVAIVQPLPQGLAPALDAQDGLYTVLLRGIENGKDVTERRVVSCVSAALNPYEQWQAVEDLACQPQLRFVVSNTTEAGIADVEEPQPSGRCPDSFPAKVTALLAARYRKLGGTAATGLVFLPCELIEANGTTLKRIVLAHARRWQLDAGFIAWIEQHNHFLDTLVDRIVPGYPANEAEGLWKQWGYEDRLVVAAEPFHVWVIQGPAALAKEFPLDQAGLNVIWTDDLQPYRTRKVRILNGAHTASALAAYCAGLDTVQSMMTDETVSAYLRRVMFDEIVPFVPLPDAERQGYAATIVERFGNPFIRHELISIALNSASKWKVRVLPTVKDFVAARGRAPQGLAFSLAALLWFYRGRMVGSDYLGWRDAGDYPIRDDAAVLQIMADAWQAGAAGRTAEVAAKLLKDTRLWGEDLTALPGLAAAVTGSLAAIEAGGIKAAMQKLDA